MKTYSITTLGCKVNRYESEALAEKLEDQGWRIAQKEEAADLCIVNTCTVTGKAAMQSRQEVRKMIRNHPDAMTVATGCYAQVAADALSAIPGVDWVVGNGRKHLVPEFIERGRRAGETIVEDLTAPVPFQDLPLTKFGARTRAFLKIQDGCDAFCSYCIVPFARGRSRSLRPDLVVDRVERLAREGYNEVVLCGIHIGQYGQDLVPEMSLAELFRSLDNPNGIGRIRLSSIEPMELTEELLQHIDASDRICPHLHIPLQSGDNDILKAMNRPYTAQFYRDLLHHLIEAIPHVSIGVDVMAGFPSETDEAFENTYRLIEELPVAYLHVFPFSPHKGTAAERLGSRVTPQTSKKRCRQLRLLGQQKKQAFFERFIGTTQDVLVEGVPDKSTGLLKGFTGNYIPVLLQGNQGMINQVVRVTLEKTHRGRVLGRLAARSMSASIGRGIRKVP